MKNLCLLFMIVSLACKNDVSKIKLEPTKTYEKYKSFIADSDLPDNEEPYDSLYIFRPVSFKLINNTHKKFIIRNIGETDYQPLFINEKYYNFIPDEKIFLEKGVTNILVFKKMPIATKYLDKPLQEKFHNNLSNDKLDSISLETITPKLQEEIDKAMNNDHITIRLEEQKSNEGILIYHCLKSQQTVVYDADSLFKANPLFDYDCATGKGYTIKLSKSK